MASITPGTTGGSVQIGSTPTPNWAEKYGIANVLDSAFQVAQANYVQQQKLEELAKTSEYEMAKQQAMIDQYYKPGLEIEKSKAEAEAQKAKSFNRPDETFYNLLNLWDMKRQEAKKADPTGAAAKQIDATYTAMFKKFYDYDFGADDPAPQIEALKDKKARKSQKAKVLRAG